MKLFLQCKQLRIQLDVYASTRWAALRRFLIDQRNLMKHAAFSVAELIRSY